MDKAVKRSLCHPRSALGDRDSCSHVSWLRAHRLDFPAHDAYRKEWRKLREQLGEQPLYDPSSTHSLVRKWGPSIWNIIHSMEFAACGDINPIERNAKRTAGYICNNPSTIFKGSLNITMPESKGSSVIFLCCTLGGKVASDHGLTFIPTRHLLAIFEEQHGQKSNKEALKLLYALSPHSLTRTSTSWIHEKSMHNRLVMSDKALSIFQGSLWNLHYKCRSNKSTT